MRAVCIPAARTCPADHEAAGLGLAKQVQPSTPGKPSKDGKIVLLSVGMSNTSQSSQGRAASSTARRTGTRRWSSSTAPRVA
jgi:hypothetical protein